MSSLQFKQGNPSLQLQCLTIFTCLPFGVIGVLTDDQGNKATLNGEMLDQDVYHYIASHLVRGHHDHGQGPIRPKLWETSETLH